MKSFDLSSFAFPETISLLNKEMEEFYRVVYSGDLHRYLERVRALGFVGKQRVLDAGCGFGQWSFALAVDNASVYGIDSDPEKVGLADRLAKENHVPHVTFSTQSLESINYPDNYFDAIFCYSVIYQTEEKKVIPELYRVLKKGGVIYLNFNSVGWYLHLLFYRVRKERCLIQFKRALRALTNIRLRDQHITTVSGLSRRLNHSGFRILEADGDGRINLCPEKYRPSLFYQKYYYSFFPGVWEILAVKE